MLRSSSPSESADSDVQVNSFQQNKAKPSPRHHCKCLVNLSMASPARTQAEAANSSGYGEEREQLTWTSSYPRFRQYGLAWLMASLSLVLLILTVAYASRSLTLSSYRYVRSSGGHIILVLRVLSELTSILLGLTLTFTMERVQWRLIIRKNGQRCLSFLSLAPGARVCPRQTRLQQLRSKT